MDKSLQFNNNKIKKINVLKSYLNISKNMKVSMFVALINNIHVIYNVQNVKYIVIKNIIMKVNMIALHIILLIIVFIKY